jgi:DNA polymerase elongation subunit (family B)
MGKNLDIIFQILDWSYYHKETEDGRKKFTVRLFGMTDEKQTIHVEVTHFTPYFYVELPDNWSEAHLAALMNVVKNKVPPTYMENFVRTTIIKKYKFWGFTNEKQFKFARLVFDDYETFRRYQWVFDRELSILQLGIRNMKFQLYEANIEPMLRCMHLRDLYSCGWAKIDSGNYSKVPTCDAETSCEINIIADYTALFKYDGKESDIQPFTIAAFDIECVSGDGSFPQPTRPSDKIIMIATTFSRYGEDNCYYRNVIVLGSCNEIEGAEVVQCQSEEEVLVEWAKMIRKKDPDFMTGWNIFGFDETYIFERCKLLSILPKVSRLSRVVNEQSPFKIKELASSALGENILKYFDMIGRVHFDLMKVVQKDYKLDSYKLDSVSALFFREIIISFEKCGENTLVETKGTYGIKDGQYTTIVHNDGVTDYEHMNKKKFKILKIDKNTILLEGRVEFDSLLQFLSDPKHKIFWCQVKDDVKPREIFSKFSGSKEDRTELAMYNIQDCELCNKLTTKLQVIVDNMCMANVCNVPLCYLFMRGQGVKIFSLVSKKCRQKNYLIPVIQKKQKKDQIVDESKWNKHFSSAVNTLNKTTVVADDDEDEGFEGAIVFDPIPGLYLSPIFVLDYASLYPNSMRFRNLSHECIVLDDRYKNLPEYDYNIITYNNNDVNKTPAPPCMFAKKKDGKRGILPEILTDLLDARSRTRKMIDEETEPFKKKVLDRMQLAYKVTANSLYGQTGAPTSPLFMKEIAACTTATGREMLKYSRTFAEEVFSKIINYASGNDIDKYMKFMKKTCKYVEDFDYTPDDSKFMGVFDNCECGDKLSPRHGLRTLCKLTVSQPIKSWKHAFFEALRQKILEFMDGFRVEMKVIYGDTDSIFVDPHITSNETKKLQIDVCALEKAIKLGVLASMVICTLLPEPMKQEYEKTMWPFMQISKKRYVGNLYETDPKKFFQKSMGIVLKRRDNAQIVKIVCGGIVDQLLNKRDPKGAIEFTRNTLRKILTNQYPIDKFIIAKTLREKYANRTSIAHAVLADRMAERDPGNKPLSNDRIPYVFTVVKQPVTLQGERVETPDYVIHNGLQIDYLYYITNQIMKPALQFLGLVAENPEEIFNKTITIEKNRQKGIRPVTSYH